MIYFMKKNSLWEIKNNILINKGGKEGVSEIPSLSIFQWRVKKVIKTKINITSKIVVISLATYVTAEGYQHASRRSSPGKLEGSP